MKNFAILVLAAFASLSPFHAGADASCSLNSEVNPFAQFNGAYKVVTYRSCNGKEECNAPQAVKLSFQSEPGSTDAILQVQYERNQSLHLRLPNFSRDDEGMTYDLCGNEELTRLFMLNKDEMISTRIIMIRQFNHFLLLTDDGAFSETMALSKN